MRKHFPVFVLLVLFILASCVPAPEGVHIEIQSPWVRAASVMEASSGMDGMGGSTSAAYMVIQNPGTEPDTLIDVRSDAAEIVELHTSQTKNGVTMMSAVESVPVPARGKAELKPGSLHIMFIKLKNDLAAGDTVSLTLVFEKSGEIQVEAEVKNP